MSQLLDTMVGQIRPTTLVDIGITALVIYWLFSLIRGTRAVRLVIGVSVILLIYAVAQVAGLRLFTQILQASAVVGLFALVVVFQPELRRGLDRLGRVGSFAWLTSPADEREADHVAELVARAAIRLGTQRHGALIVIERDTGLEEIAETGVMLHGDLSSELLESLFFPRSPLHDGAVVIHGATIVAAGAILPSTETTLQVERFGLRHRAALGVTEATDAIVVVVSEESGQASLVERARIRRNLDETQLRREIALLLAPGRSGRAALRDRLSAARSHPRPRAPLPGSLRRAALGDLRRLRQASDEQAAEPVAPETDGAAAATQGR